MQSATELHAVTFELHAVTSKSTAHRHTSNTHTHTHPHIYVPPAAPCCSLHVQPPALHDNIVPTCTPHCTLCTTPHSHPPPCMCTTLHPTGPRAWAATLPLQYDASHSTTVICWLPLLTPDPLACIHPWNTDGQHIVGLFRLGWVNIAADSAQTCMGGCTSKQLITSKHLLKVDPAFTHHFLACSCHTCDLCKCMPHIRLCAPFTRQC
jgi:hypothetical protein